MNYKVINILQTREIRATLTKSEEELLDFIERNFKEIPNYSAIKICEKAFSSQATLNRVCKKLGFKGFSELKFSIEEDLKLMDNSKNSYIYNTIFYIENINFGEINDFIIFIISSSGETLRIKHLAKNLKELNRVVVAITKKDSSLDTLSTFSFTHNISIDKLNVIVREQQLHMIIMVNELINKFQNG